MNPALQEAIDEARRHDPGIPEFKNLTYEGPWELAAVGSASSPFTREQFPIARKASRATMEALGD